MRILWLGIGAAALAFAQNGTIQARYQLGEVPLGQILLSRLGVDVNDRGVKLGGIGSGMWHDPAEPNIFWMITDRGPNGQVAVNGVNRRTFPLPEFTPFILQVVAVDSKFEVAQAIPLTGLNGKGVTGVSNAARDEAPYDCTATVRLPFNPNGLDTEGIVRLRDGSFWMVEEYGPSILKANSRGVVEKRFQPRGLANDSTQYQSVGVLPSIYSRRTSNRGFEDIAVSGDQRTVYAALQSPLQNPNAATGNESLNTRILGFDIRNEAPSGEWVYRFQPASEFEPGTRPRDLKVSGLVVLNDRYMLVLERTDLVAKIYKVDLQGATNILRSKWDAETTSPSLESLTAAQLDENGVKTLPKEFILEMDSRKGWPQKIEGIAVLDGTTIGVVNDNDFGVGDFTGIGCELKDTGFKSQLLIVKLDKAVK